MGRRRSGNFLKSYASRTLRSGRTKAMWRPRVHAPKLTVRAIQHERNRRFMRARLGTHAASAAQPTDSAVSVTLVVGAIVAVLALMFFPGAAVVVLLIIG